MKAHKVNGGTAAASSSAAPLSHYNDQGVRERWPALVYRFQTNRGWEVYSDRDLEKSSTASKKINAASTSTKIKGSSGGGNSAINSSNNNNNGGEVEELTVAPAVGCIEVRKMRLRLHLKHTKNNNNNNNNPAQNNGPGGISQAENGTKKQQTVEQQGSHSTKGVNNDNNYEEEEYDSDTPGSDGWNNNPLLVRRRNSLLVSVRRGYGAIMFQFKSTHDCIEFCDRLVYLNRDLLSPSTTTAADSNDILQGQVVGTSSSSSLIGNNGRFVNGMDKRELYMDSMRENKRHRTSTFGDTLDQNNNNNHGRNASEDYDDNVSDDVPPSIKMYEMKKQCQRREDIMSYVAKLAHSEEFLGFVEELERGMEGSEDTAAIHAAFGL